MSVILPARYGQSIFLNGRRRVGKENWGRGFPEVGHWTAKDTAANCEPKIGLHKKLMLEEWGALWYEYLEKVMVINVTMERIKY